MLVTFGLHFKNLHNLFHRSSQKPVFIFIDSYSPVVRPFFVEKKNTIVSRVNSVYSLNSVLARVQIKTPTTLFCRKKNKENRNFQLLQCALGEHEITQLLSLVIVSLV